MGPRHRLRRLCQKLVVPSFGERIDGVRPRKNISEAFAVLMFLATIALVVTACYITPLYNSKQLLESGNQNWTLYLEIGFLILFSLEFVIKIIADGLVFTPNAYLRSSWNWIDFIVLISLWINFIASIENDLAISRIVSGLKALRALRILTVSETAKNNFHNTMISGFGKIINAAIISLCLLFPFSLWGLYVFAGRLGYCLDGESGRDSCKNEYKNEVFNWDVLSPNVYKEPQLEFNKFSDSFATLFEIVSLEGWADLLMNVMKSTGVGTPPDDFATPFNGFFVIVFNFTSTIFILTLFVSVIISNYSKTTGRAFLTSDQISWYQVKKLLVQVRPSRREDVQLLSGFRKFCYYSTVERNPIWQKSLNFTLFVQVINLLLECYPSRRALDIFRQILFLIVAFIFVANSLMLFCAQGWRVFIRYKWNIFNVFISFGAFFTTIGSFFVNEESFFLNINKLFFVGILCFIIPRSDRLSELLRFASASLLSLISLLFTWVIVFLVFAIAMNQNFGMTKVGQNTSDNINLRSVPKALILLFRCSFGEGWNYIMDDFTLEEPFCTKTETGDTDCGSKELAYILFILWNILSMYIFLNMFISLILDNFSYFRNKSNYRYLLKREEIRKFKKTWQIFDPEGVGFIQPYHLPKLLRSLDGALSFHFYYGSLAIKVLSHKWFKERDPNNPYDLEVNYDEIQRTLNSLDVDKVKMRRKKYERFIEEALLEMELNDEPGISFSRLLLKLPLYTSFEAGQCLNLIDFLDRRLLDQKVERRLRRKRVYETVAAFCVRRKYLRDKRLLVAEDDSASNELGNNSVLLNQNLEANLRLSRNPSRENYDERRRLNEGRSDEEIPLMRSPFFSSEDEVYDNSNPSGFYLNQEHAGSGIYIPKSPLSTYKARNQFQPQHKKGSLPPKLSISIPNMDNYQTRSGSSSHNPSPFLDSAAIRYGGSSRSNSFVSLNDLPDLNETLKDTQWGEALRDVQSSNNDMKSDKND